MSMPHGHSPATAAFGSPRRRYHALGSAPVQILRPSGFSQPQHLVRAGEAVLPADASTSPFSELQLAPISEGIATKRLRQHVNPLASRHTAPPPTPDWPAIYAQPTMPLVLDLGCGSGRFLLLLAQRAAGKAPTGSHPSSNYLGIEIRQALVERANSWAARLGASRHVAFMYANASLWLGQLLHSYPGPLDLVCIQYPDPHFKRKHHKRRIFQPKLIQAVTQRLRPGGRVLLQSDVLEVAVAMRNSFEMVAGDSYQLAGVHSGRPGAVFYEEQPAAGPPAPQHSGQAQQQAHRPGSSWSEAVEEAAAKASSSGGHGQQEEQLDDEPNFVSQWAAGGWLLENPMQTPTERELHVLQQGLPVYRMLLVKK